MDLMRRCPALPDEIMEDEIFARLPAKSVLACRCLSRAWAAALTSDDFIDRYHTLHGGRLKILRLQDEYHGAALLMGILLDISAECFPRFVKMFWDDECPTVPSLVTTQCRGLIILQLSPMGIDYVCNPSTGQKIELPEGRTTGCRRNSDWNHEYTSLGLGYGVRARRHKVVRISYRGCDGEGRPAFVGCEVYVLNGGSTQLWRPVCAKPTGWVQRDRNSTFAQGHVYWLAYRKHELYYGRCRAKEALIVSFSVCEETFATVPPPPGMDSETLLKQGLTELDGRLCLFSWGYADHGHRYDVWLLREYGSWDLHCRIEVATASIEVNRFLGSSYNLSYARVSPLAFIDDGRRILFTKTDFPDVICAYTPLTGDIENILDLSSPQTLLTPYEVALYEESITTLGRQACKDATFTSSLSTQALSLVLRLLPECTLQTLMCVCRSWRTMIAIHRRYGGPFLTLGEV